MAINQGPQNSGSDATDKDSEDKNFEDKNSEDKVNGKNSKQLPRPDLKSDLPDFSENVLMPVTPQTPFPTTRQAKVTQVQPPKKPFWQICQSRLRFSNFKLRGIRLVT
jgi:hypothetical protein